MDPEFIRILVRVAIIGGTIGIIGAAAVYFALRSFRTGEFRASLIVAALLAFVLVCCIVLLKVSFVR
ncbi:MAG TPA: hypothetical protein VL284_12945 [Thermoanaerobaculia bacterium]|nr:hypothetical protein [Thermoanaerobaculia bacterium]